MCKETLRRFFLKSPFLKKHETQRCGLHFFFLQKTLVYLYSAITSPLSSFHCYAPRLDPNGIHVHKGFTGNKRHMFSHDFLPHCVLSLSLHQSRIKWPLIQRLHFLLLLLHTQNIHLRGFIVLNKVLLLVKPKQVFLFPKPNQTATENLKGTENNKYTLLYIQSWIWSPISTLRGL